MKKVLPFILIFALIITAKISSAQKVEVTAGISGNLYNYSGNLSSLQNDYYGGVATDYYDSPPYGKRPTTGYGTEINLKIIAKDGFMLGMGSGYDILRSKSNLTYTFIDDSNPANDLTNYGYAVTTIKQINVNPFLGYRFKSTNYSVDLQIGAEVAFFLEYKQRKVFNGNYPTDYTIYYGNKDAINNDRDYRLKGGIGFNYHKFAINFSYARSLSNLYKDGSFVPNSSHNSLYSQLIKTGISYRIF